MRLIDADALKYNWLNVFDHKKSLIECIDEQPTIKTPPPKILHAYWKDLGRGDYMGSWCSEVVSNRLECCPYCNAIMDE